MGSGKPWQSTRRFVAFLFGGGPDPAAAGTAAAPVAATRESPMSLRRPSPGPAGVAAVLLVAALGASTAPAAVLNWINPGGGQTSVTTNWNPAQVPTAADALIFNTPGNYFVTFNPVANAAAGLSFRRGILGIDTNAGSPIAIGIQGLQFATFAGDSATATVVSDELVSSGPIAIGQSLSAFGELRVSGGFGIVRIAGPTNDLAVGNFGNGRLEIVGGGTLEVGDDVLVGNASGSVGRIEVTGRSTSPLVPSTLTTTETGGDMIVGNGGYGEVTVDTDGLVYCSGSLWVSPVSRPGFDGNGDVTVGEASSTRNAQLVTGGDLLIGGTSLIASGDLCTVHVRRNGSVLVNGKLWLVGSGNATLRIDGGAPGGEVLATDFVLSRHGNLDFPGGRITLLGGTLDTDAQPLTIDSATGGPGNGPTLTLDFGSTANLPTDPSTFVSLTLGAAGFGEMRVRNDAVCTLAGNLRMGSAAGALGVLRLDDGDLFAGNVDAGLQGRAQVFLSDRARLTTDTFDLGTQVNDASLLDLEGRSLVEVGFGMTIGRNVALADPTTTASVRDESVLRALSMNIQGGGGLTLATDGSAEVTGLVQCGGEVNLDGGLLVADSLAVASGGELNGNGLVRARIGNRGVVSPGLSAGRIETNATFTQSASGVLRMELGNHAASEWDTLAVAAAVQLDGTLALVRLPSFAASFRDAFTLMTYTSRTGVFADVTLDGGPLEGFELEYGPTALVLTAAGSTDAPEAAGPGLPRELALHARRIAGGAEVELALPGAADVELAVFDVAGRQVAVLADGLLPAGRRTHRLDGAAAPASGIYFVRARVAAADGVAVRTARIAILR